MTDRAKCNDTEHDYRKFDEASVVCRKCGDQRIVDVAALVAKLPQPIYYPCPYPHYPHYPQWTWTTTTPFILGGTTTVYSATSMGDPEKHYYVSNG